VGVCVVHAFVVEPAAEKVPSSQSTTTASAVVEHGVVMRLPAEVPVHVPGHVAAVVPSAEYVPAAQSTTTASAVVEHGVVMRLPALVVEQGVHVPPVHVAPSVPPAQYSLSEQSPNAVPISSAAAISTSARCFGAILGVVSR